MTQQKSFCREYEEKCYYHRTENDQLKKKLDAYEKKAKIKQIKNLTKRAKTKVNGKVQKLKEKVNAIKENFQACILQEFESHILRQQ